MIAVTDYLFEKLKKEGKNPTRECLTLIPSDGGRKYYVDNDGSYWRAYLFLHGKGFDLPDSLELFQKAGFAFGNFQREMDGFPSSTLHEVIPHFHDTEKRFSDLLLAIKENRSGRLNTCEDLVKKA